jgi:hypothetical protein
MKIKTGLYGEMEPSSITYTSVIDRSDWNRYGLDVHLHQLASTPCIKTLPFATFRHGCDYVLPHSRCMVKTSAVPDWDCTVRPKSRLLA